MKYIVTSSGLEAREKNPYIQNYWVLKDTMIGHINKDWIDFEKNVKTYPLTQPMPPGSEIEGELVWQGKTLGPTPKWFIFDPNKTLYLEFEEITTRQALQPIIPQPEKIKEETVEELAVKYVNGLNTISDEDCEKAFIAGWKAKDQHENLKIKRLEFQIECLEAENISLGDQVDNMVEMSKLKPSKKVKA
ncbi:MAG: hypothetical protein JWQ09_5848 [Segetibacter sp.]|nr:hypothetical protein [Segetibacter sp.]